MAVVSSDIFNGMATASIPFLACNCFFHSRHALFQVKHILPHQIDVLVDPPQET